jgi:TP901 family phage tail tape measure protein
VDVIVRKQGEFANLMQADFNKWIEGSAKAMANYRFGLDKLDEFNRSAFATVKVGVTNYDQIASVMSTYAGSAASANQNFNTANKLFALFTAKVKSVDEASTLTKSLFNDLTKETTIKAFERIGINMYDVNGRFRQADDILIELNKKFRSLTDDRSVIALKNQFTGSEGLIAFIQAATDKTEGLKTAFDTFDNAELGLVKATKIARDDINYINDQLQNRTSVLWAQIGKDMIPFKSWLAEAVHSSVRWLMTPEHYKKTITGEAASNIRDKHASLITPENLTDREYGDMIADAKDRRALFYEQLEANKAFKNNIYKAFNPDRYTQYHTAAASIGEINDLIKESQAKRAQVANSPFAAETPTSDTAGSEKKLPDKAGEITQAAQPAKSLTVNIDSFVKGGINTQKTELQQMDENQLENWFRNMFLRVIANVDTAYQQ